MNKELLKLRSYYNEDVLSQERVNEHWQELSGRLEERQYHRHRYTFQYATFFAILTLFFSMSMVAIQAAAPSSPLYPVKLLSESTAAHLSGKYDVLLEHRTDAIINAAQRKSEAEIKKAAAEYEATLKQAQVRKQTNEEVKESLKETLKRSEEKLKAVTPPSEQAKNLLHQSIKATEKTRQEVKGASTNTGNGNAPASIPTQKPSTPGNSENAGSNSGSPTNNGSNASGNTNIPQNPGSAAEDHRKNNK